MKKSTPILSVAAITVAIILVRPTTEWTQCSRCGVQQIERGIARRVIESWSVYEFDEYGTYAEWRTQHHGAECEHDFQKVRHKTPATSLEELQQPPH